MLHVDTGVLLAALTPLAQAPGPLAISPWSATELHSALGLKVRTGALNPSQAEVVLEGFERSLAPAFLMLAVEPQDFRNADACLRGWRMARARGSAGLLKQRLVRLNWPEAYSRLGRHRRR
jgi:hypothetical protein